MKTESTKEFPQHGIATGWVYTPSVPGVNVSSNDYVSVYNEKIYISKADLHSEDICNTIGFKQNHLLGINCPLIFHWKRFLMKSNVQLESKLHVLHKQKISLSTVVLRSAYIYIIMCSISTYLISYLKIVWEIQTCSLIFYKIIVQLT